MSCNRPGSPGELAGMIARIALGASLSMIGLAADGAQCAAQSGSERAALVELYTSEGCSSCPPADRWLSRLPLDGPGPRVVPLAFHVDYWDALGWKDRFASPEWTARQRDGARRSGAGFVYTPQVVRNGRDFRGWSAGGSLARAAAAEGPAPVRISLGVEATPAGITVTTGVQAAGTVARRLRVSVALAESGLKTSVKAGENRGEALAHDHVVRALASEEVDASRPGTLRKLFALGRDWKPEGLAVVAFVQDPGSGEVLQALRLAACPG